MFIYNNTRVPLKDAKLDSIWVEKVIPCPDCKGTGKDTVSDYDEDEGHTTTVIDCRTCLGTSRYTEMVELVK
jgi:RecJ-like exonuclease